MTYLPLVSDDGGQALLADEDGRVVKVYIDATDGNSRLGPVSAAVNLDPCAVYYGLDVVRERGAMRAAANAKVLRFRPKGHEFGLLPPGEVSGYPVAQRAILKHRKELPSLELIELSAIFAVSTVRTSIEEAERSYRCFGELYKKAGRAMPPADDVKRCFRGLQNEKSRVFRGVVDYAPTIREVIKQGYTDRELRSVLALDTALPRGLGLAKLSFVLALLGHDTICLDARLLGRIFKDKKARDDFERTIKKGEEGQVSDHGLLAYEAVEDVFLEGNVHYDPSDPLGRARAQWLSWEAVGGKGASHSVWLEMVEAS